MTGTRIVNPAGSGEHAIVIKDVVKHFRKSTIRREYTTFKSELVNLFSRKKSEPRVEPRFIEALRGINLEIPRGQTTAILGRNGSGKSTLLKLITGIYTPTAGQLVVNGRISALLDLGAGFHPDFSGRENIIINGIILGMTRNEVKARMDEIIAFSELGEFIDEPVRTYSSGMYMRLAFAVATHVDPEILIIDEILAVGDEHFGKKSMAKMNEFKERGKTIVLVTHDLGTVSRWCDVAAWIDGGKIRRIGLPATVVAEYKEAVTLAEEQSAAFTPPALAAGGGALPQLPERPRPSTGPQVEWGARSGNFAVELSEVRLLDATGAPRELFDTEDALEIHARYLIRQPTENVGFGLRVARSDGTVLYETSTHQDGVPFPVPLPPTGDLVARIDRLGLLPGDYALDVVALLPDGTELDRHRALYRFRVSSPVADVGVVRLPHHWVVRATSLPQESPAPVRLSVS